MNDYNGWKNRATWNIAMNIGSDEQLYLAIRRNLWTRYEHVTDHLSEQGITHNPDGVEYTDPTLDIDALDELIFDLQKD